MSNNLTFEQLNCLPAFELKVEEVRAQEEMELAQRKRMHTIGRILWMYKEAEESK